MIGTSPMFCGNTYYMGMIDKPKSPVFICSDCGNPIHEGDIYLDLMGEQFCAECVPKHFKYAKKTDEKGD